MNIAPGKKTDDEKRDEDDTTASKNCSKNDLRMRLRNDKQNQKCYWRSPKSFRNKKLSNLVSCLYSKSSLLSCKDRSGGAR